MDAVGKEDEETLSFRIEPEGGPRETRVTRSPFRQHAACGTRVAGHHEAEAAASFTRHWLEEPPAGTLRPQGRRVHHRSCDYGDFARGPEEPRVSGDAPLQDVSVGIVHLTSGNGLPPAEGSSRLSRHRALVLVTHLGSCRIREARVPSGEPNAREAQRPCHAPSEQTVERLRRDPLDGCTQQDVPQVGIERRPGGTRRRSSCDFPDVPVEIGCVPIQRLPGRQSCAVAAEVEEAHGIVRGAAQLLQNLRRWDHEVESPFLFQEERDRGGGERLGEGSEVVGCLLGRLFPLGLEAGPPHRPGRDDPRPPFDPPGRSGHPPGTNLRAQELRDPVLVPIGHRSRGVQGGPAAPEMASRIWYARLSARRPWSPSTGGIERVRTASTNAVSSR